MGVKPEELLIWSTSHLHKAGCPPNCAWLSSRNRNTPATVCVCVLGRRRGSRWKKRAGRKGCSFEEYTQAAAGRQPASSKQLTALLSRSTVMDEPYPLEMSPSEQSVSSFPSASHLSQGGKQPP